LFVDARHTSCLESFGHHEDLFDELHFDVVHVKSVSKMEEERRRGANSLA
jgi:hypothetical protein